MIKFAIYNPADGVYRCLNRDRCAAWTTERNQATLYRYRSNAVRTIAALQKEAKEAGELPPTFMIITFKLELAEYEPIHPPSLRAP